MAAVGLGAVLLLAGCGGPLGPIAGGRLAGTPVCEPVADWSFAAAHRLLQIETRPGDPHSVHVGFTVLAGRLYVDIGTPADWHRWRAYLRADPRARVRIGERIYPVVATPVTDSAELAAVRAAWRGGPPPADATLVRLDSDAAATGGPTACAR